MAANLPGLVDYVPVFSVKNGQIFMVMGTLTLVMPVGVFLDACEDGKGKIVDWQREQCGLMGRIDHGNVVRLPRRYDHFASPPR